MKNKTSLPPVLGVSLQHGFSGSSDTTIHVIVNLKGHVAQKDAVDFVRQACHGHEALLTLAQYMSVASDFESQTRAAKVLKELGVPTE